MYLLTLFISNAAALGVIAYFVKGFEITPTIQGFLLATVIFTIINLIVRPLLKAILTPIIFLTLGFGIVIVNGATLYLLDFFSKDITIKSTEALIYATLIISVINIFIGFEKKALKRASDD